MATISIAAVATTLPTPSSGGGPDWAARWALYLTIANAALALLQYYRTVVRLAKVRYIGTVGSTSVKDIAEGRPEGDVTLAIDVLSSGAAIWDMEVILEMFVPASLNVADAQQFGGPLRQAIHLEPARQINPLNSGQAMTFEIKKSELMRNRLGPQLTGYEHVGSMLPRVPHRYLVLNVYCSGRRIVLKRVRSRRLRWAVYNFFGVREGAAPPLKNLLWIKLSHWVHSERGTRVRTRVERRWPGLFDTTYARIDRFLTEKPPEV